MMYNPLCLPQNPKFFLQYRTLQKISTLETNSIFSSLTLRTPNILLIAIYYLNTKHVRQHTKTMLAKLQLPFVSD